jgi:hypothetical protein
MVWEREPSELGREQRGGLMAFIPQRPEKD